ncbi:MAG TPA: cyclic pyranopterin monophosphate synthase MoaC [Spirochaetota bacterium]|nr:cyclic pyranopterin monophosphate synthase MoaC [Spirochaetota bacterium]HPI88070.1 cyclic pyranopterin monophosphate synthase MoaC [Spirochaetota bacterium]HPR46445.1 cyclic pyranopterin monophosphate synthase MoaC [Spirochaetota bacterium]
MTEFSHYSKNGLPTMVDVTEKTVTSRSARATGFVKMAPATIDLIEQQLLPKGNLFEIAKVAGIQGAKRTYDLIPLCHPLNLTYIDIDISIDHHRQGVQINSQVRLDGKTGAEMEALTAVSIAALTVYDMCKAVDKDMVIENIQVIEKKGGKSDINKA